MSVEIAELDQMQAQYKAAVERWIAAIREEEQLASVDHSVAQVDQWEQAAIRENALRNEVREAKKRYENALREKFFHI